MGKQRHEDPAMRSVRKRLEKSGLTYQALGERMDFPEKSARQSAWQFLQSGDPQISMLRRFADALGISLATLIR